MGIYKDVLFVESKVIPFNKKFILELYSIISFYEELENIIKKLEVSANLLEQKTRLIELNSGNIVSLKNSMNEIIYKTDNLQKSVDLAKKDIILHIIEELSSNITALINDIDEAFNFVNNHTFVIILVRSLGLYDVNLYINFTNKVSALIRNHADMNAFLEDILIRINNDIKIIKESKSEKKVSDILGFSYIYKIDLWKELNNSRVLLRFTNKIDFSKTQFKFSFGEETRILEEYIRADCNLFLKQCKNEEKDLLIIKNMTARQMERRSLEILKNTFLKVLESNLGNVKADVKRINIELNYDTNWLGSYEDKSDFKEIFIQIILTPELLRVLEFNQLILSEDSNTYKTILHELFHSKDYMLNNRSKDILVAASKNYLVNKDDLSSVAVKISGKDPSLRTKLLAQILFHCRAEGFATISKLFTVINTTGSYSTIELTYSFISTSSNNTDFVKLVNDKDISSTSVTDSYDKGILHRIGTMMITMIFLDSTRGQFSYTKKSYRSKTNIQFSNILSNDMIADLLSGTTYVLAADNDKVSTIINNFIQKLSLTPPHLFLEKYELACKNFGIEAIFSKADFKDKVSK